MDRRRRPARGSYWLKDSYPRYRFQVDDNSFFTRDIHQKGYKSIFESPYLGMFREFNRKYGAKVVLNLFYSTPEEDFNLSQLSDKYKSEWQDNAPLVEAGPFMREMNSPIIPSWSERPNSWARISTYIEREVKRFAGEKVYTRTALLHWGSIRPESLQVLIGRGWRTLSGSCWPLRGKGLEYIGRYQVPEYAIRYVNEHDAWYNFDNGLLFAKIDLCCNRVPAQGHAADAPAGVRQSRTPGR